MLDSVNIPARLKAYGQALSQRGFRLPVLWQGVLSDILESIASSVEESSSVLYISENEDHRFSHLLPHHYRQLLGQEWSHIIYDVYSGINANILGAASGSVKAGGFFFMVAPPTDEWLQNYQKWIQKKESEVHLNVLEQLPQAFFIQRIIQYIEQYEYAVRIQPETTCLPEDLHLKSAETSCVDKTCAHNTYTHKTSNTELIQHLKEDGLPHHFMIHHQQIEVIQQMIRVANGHSRRPLVVTADRGRGKSAALGLAAAYLVNHFDKTLVITAHHKKAVEQVFYWFKSQVAPEKWSQFIFLPPDELRHYANNQVQNDFFYGKVAQKTQKPFELLLVDEAAAIPLPILTDFLKCFSRMIFTSTLQGYEGSGRGFYLRFKKTLDQCMPQWRHYEITHPIRWQLGDPLEHWTNALLLLDKQSLDSVTIETSNNVLTRLKSGQQDLIWDVFYGGKFIPQEALLNQVFALLVTSHYQTTPEDLRWLCDHPRCVLLVASVNDHDAQKKVVGVMSVMQEGGIDRALIEQVRYGKRRLQGHMTVQSLAFHLDQPDLAALNGWRIQRIAVHESFRRRGVGSQLIEKIKLLAQNQQQSFLSSSFSASDDLLPFWFKNHFFPLRLGLNRDKASSCHSLLVVYPFQDTQSKQMILSHTILSHRISSHWQEVKNTFFKRMHILLLNCFSELPPIMIRQMWQAFPDAIKPLLLLEGTLDKDTLDNPYKKNTSKRAFIETYVNGHRYFDDAIAELTEYIYYVVYTWLFEKRALDNKIVEDMIAVFFQNNRDYIKHKYHLKGVKGFENWMKQCIGHLMKDESMKQ